MRLAQLQEMYELEDSYWWFIGRRRIVRRLIERYGPRHRPLRILDAGCGTGGTLVALEGLGELWGCDISPEALEMCRSRREWELCCCSVQRLGFAAESFDVVVSADVLEHVEDDEGAVREMARVLRPGGLLVAAVPAHMWLWSEHDEALHHLRRYHRRRLRDLLQGAGLEIRKLTEAVMLALPAVLVYRGLRRLTRRREGPRTSLVRLPAPLNCLLVRLLDIENALIALGSLPLGTSLVAAAAKPAREP
ncbi:MAG: class I SAM-dependent methyltransferase [Armatimonadota bacterium]